MPEKVVETLRKIADGVGIQHINENERKAISELLDGPLRVIGVGSVGRPLTPQELLMLEVEVWKK
jgi:hypothetical protein